MIDKVLIANRGEIALRILRACEDLGLRAVVAYSEADRDSLPVRLADEAICIGPASPAKSYLNVPNVISAALITGCDAIHPGYGFLAENPYVADICEQHGLVFVGPTARVIEEMADKALARRIMHDAGLPVLPGTFRPLTNLVEARACAEEIGYPVILKAAAGGGGRGMRMARDEAELVQGFTLAATEAQSAFGNGALYLEKFLTNCRHIEIQVLADRHGNAIHLGERECSIQRRHQKLLEEAPSCSVAPEIRRHLGSLAVEAVKRIGYVGAGTLEFLLDRDGHFAFMEMNTRIQVEHPVTEEITRIDLVKWQLRVAAGETLTLESEGATIQGHAIECRLNAEDVQRDFAPEAGTIRTYLPPGGPGIRVDSHLFTGYEVPPYYDSLLGKIIAWGEDRSEAIRRMRRALSELLIDGVKTTREFHLALLQQPAFVAGDVQTDFVERNFLRNGRPLPVGSALEG